MKVTLKKSLKIKSASEMADYLRTSIEKVNSENYSIWSHKIELLLIREDAWDGIEE